MSVDAVSVISCRCGVARPGLACALPMLGAMMFACAPLPQTAPPATAPAAPPGFPAQRYEQEFTGQGRIFKVLPEDSKAILRVYRGGRLARLGHNHVIAGRHLQGYVLVGDDFSRSRADLYLPLHRLVVDEPADRAAAGGEFATELTADAIAGTRANMLGSRGLNAERYPFLEVAVVVGDGSIPQVRLDLAISLHGVTQRFSVPARLDIDDDRLRAEGEFEISQSAFGVTPFTALGGALLVQDAVQVSYSVLARRVP